FQSCSGSNINRYPRVIIVFGHDRRPHTAARYPRAAGQRQINERFGRLQTEQRGRERSRSRALREVGLVRYRSEFRLPRNREGAAPVKKFLTVRHGIEGVNHAGLPLWGLHLVVPGEFLCPTGRRTKRKLTTSRRWESSWERSL